MIGGAFCCTNTVFHVHAINCFQIQHPLKEPGHVNLCIYDFEEKLEMTEILWVWVLNIRNGCLPRACLFCRQSLDVRSEAADVTQPMTTYYVTWYMAKQ